MPHVSLDDLFELCKTLPRLTSPNTDSFSNMALQGKPEVRHLHHGELARQPRIGLQLAHVVSSYLLTVTVPEQRSQRNSGHLK